MLVELQLHTPISCVNSAKTRSTYYYHYYLYSQEVKIPGLKTKIKNKLEWLRVGIVLNWKSLLLSLFLYPWV